MPKKLTKKSSNIADAMDFEQALNELEGLVEKMEKGELSLEQAMADFQRGIELSRACQKSLRTAEQKVQLLIEQGKNEQLVPFDTDE